VTENTFDVQPVSADEAQAVASLNLAVADDAVPPDAPQPEYGPGGPPPMGPVFDPATAPTVDGTAVTSLDGQAWFRPTWRIANRPAGLLAGPDVWFDRDEQRTIRLRWTLTETLPAGAPANATSLIVGVDDVVIKWSSGSRSFGRQEPPRQPGPRAMQLGCELHPDEADKLELAMCDAASGCHVEVTHHVHYAVQLPPATLAEPRILTFGQGYPQLAMQFRSLGCPVHDLDVDGNPFFVVELEDSQVEIAKKLYEEYGFHWDTMDELATWTDRLIPLLGAVRFQELTGLLSGGQEEHFDEVVQSIPFVFNPNDEANRPIYRALHGAANLTNTWQKSAPGWLRTSAFPDTIYRVPDEVRLAFNPSMGTPHVISTLHTDDQDRASVRVLLRVAAWQDPRRIQEVRALTASPAAQVIVGPVESATLRLGGSFPEAIRLRGGAEEVTLPLSEGADLLMELSLEYFQLLCSMLTGPVGLSGDVEVRLSDQVVTHVPLSLRMDKVDDLPVTVTATGAQPTTVTVTNASGAAIRAGGCVAVFLQKDSASVVPKASYPARCTSAFPLELAAGASAELTFEPASGEVPADAWWNAVLVDLLDKQLVADADATLLRAHELAGTGELTWDLTVSSPVFATAELPARWAGLASLEVEVSAPGFDTTTVILRKDTPSRTITLRKPLAALVAGGASGIHTATYRVRNNYTDHQGEWSAPQQQSGEELVAFPNP
jgi:hypothetical protein